MRNASIVALFGLLIGNSAIADSICGNDVECKRLERLSDQREDRKIVETTSPEKTYSPGAVFYIGLAYKSLASRKGVTFEQAVDYYLKALEFNYYPAHLDLYRLYLEKDQKKALGHLRRYLETNPGDPNAYFAAGEEEYREGNYKASHNYLRQAKKLSKGHTAGIDWLLFKVNYILRNYSSARKALDDALAQARLKTELKQLKDDPRFADVLERPEFKTYQQMIRDAWENGGAANTGK